MIASMSFLESDTFSAHIPAMNLKRAVDRDRGERIKYVRKELLNLTSQEEFAELLASATGTTLTRGAVGNWELGKDVGLDNLKAISELAHVSIDWLAYNAGERPTIAMIQAKMAKEGAIRTDEQILGMLRRIEGLSETDIQVAFAVIKNALAAKQAGSAQVGFDDPPPPATRRRVSQPSR